MHPDDDDLLARHLAWASRLDPRAPPAAVRDALERVTDARGHPGSHEDYERTRDRALHGGDGERAQRTLGALEELTRRAWWGEALSSDALAVVQSVVLGRRARWRTGDAFARGGLHRYGAIERIDAVMDARLRAWEGSGAHAMVVAAGVLLDVAFVHPFDDGNGRASRLWCTFVLRRARAAEPRMRDVVAVPKVPGDDEAFWRLVRVMALSACAVPPHAARTERV